MMISPTKQLPDWPSTPDGKIDLFNEWIREWQLGIARLCLEQSTHAGYAALSIMMAYFEMIARYREGYVGTDKVEVFFKRGLEYVYPGLPDAAKTILYKRVRCGLYHVGMVRGGNVILNTTFNAALALSPDNSTVAINPVLLVETLMENFSNYIAELKEQSSVDLRQRFLTRFDNEANLRPQYSMHTMATTPSSSTNRASIEAWANGGITRPGDPGTVTP